MVSDYLGWSLFIWLFSLGHHGLPKKKKVWFLFKPEDLQAPKLYTNLDVFYLDCQWRGTMIEGELHPNCMRGSGWPSCHGVWEILGEQWSECYVVSAIGKPLEKWRKVHQYALCSLREESITWTLVWKSPFSNSLHLHCPWPPKGGSIWGSNMNNSGVFGAWCKIEGNMIRFHPLTESKITMFFEAW